MKIGNPQRNTIKIVDASRIFDQQAYFIKASVFTDVIKKVEIGFSILYQKRLSIVYSVEKVSSPGMGKGIPPKKDRNRWERKSIDAIHNC